MKACDKVADIYCDVGFKIIFHVFEEVCDSSRADCFGGLMFEKFPCTQPHTYGLSREMLMGQPV